MYLAKNHSVAKSNPGKLVNAAGPLCTVGKQCTAPMQLGRCGTCDREEGTVPEKASVGSELVAPWGREHRGSLGG